MFSYPLTGVNRAAHPRPMCRSCGSPCRAYYRDRGGLPRGAPESAVLLPRTPGRGSPRAARATVTRRGIPIGPAGTATRRRRRSSATMPCWMLAPKASSSFRAPAFRTTSPTRPAGWASASGTSGSVARHLRLHPVQMRTTSSQIGSVASLGPWRFLTSLSMLPSIAADVRRWPRRYFRERKSQNPSALPFACAWVLGTRSPATA